VGNTVDIVSKTDKPVIVKKEIPDTVLKEL
jgi:hypothetical protein